MLENIIRTYHHHKKYFFMFLLTGVGTTVIYLGLFAFLWYELHMNHILAVTIAYLIGAAYQFLANRKITFKVKSPEFIQEVIRYIGLLVINYVIALIIMQFCVWAINSAFVGMVLTAITTPLTGYLIFKYWVFKIPDPTLGEIQN